MTPSPPTVAGNGSATTDPGTAWPPASVMSACSGRPRSVAVPSRTTGSPVTKNRLGYGAWGGFSERIRARFRPARFAVRPSTQVRCGAGFGSQTVSIVVTGSPGWPAPPLVMFTTQAHGLQSRSLSEGPSCSDGSGPSAPEASGWR